MSSRRSSRPGLSTMIHDDGKLWVELKGDTEKGGLRLGIDDLQIIGGERNGNRIILFAPPAKSNLHLTVVADPKPQRLTCHESLEHVDVIGGTRVSWNENAKPALALSYPYIERRCSNRRFLRTVRTQIERACHFVGRPRDLRSGGIGAVFPLPTAADFRRVSGTRYELHLATLSPRPVEALWRSTPGTLFFAIGENGKVVGMATLLEDERAILLRYRDLVAVFDWFMRAVSEPASPPLDFFSDL